MYDYYAEKSGSYQSFLDQLCFNILKKTVFFEERALLDLTASWKLEMTQLFMMILNITS